MSSGRDLARDRVVLRPARSGNHVDAIDPRSRTKGTIGKKVIAGNDRVHPLDRVGEPTEPPPAFRPTRVVRNPGTGWRHRAIENEVTRGPARRL